MARRFLNQGTYGCVYAPAFTCENPDPGVNERVSKVFKTNRANVDPRTFYAAFESEQRILDRVATYLNIIDPAEDYYIYKYHVCKFKKSTHLAAIEATCKDNDSIFKPRPEDNHIWALNYSKGGEDLFTILKRNGLNLEHFKMLLTQLKNVIQGIHLLNKTGIYHLDIKTGNIIFQNDVFKIIDFGLCKKLNRTNRLSDLFRKMYDTCWPVETILLAKTPSPEVIEKHVVEYNSSRYITQLKTMFRNVKTDLPVTRPAVKKIYDGIDVWGFGLMLTEVYRKMPNTSEFTAIKSDLATMIGKILTGARLTSGGALKAYEEFVTSFLPSPLQELHIKMNRVNKDRTDRQTMEMKRLYLENISEVSKRGHLRSFVITRTLHLFNTIVPNKFIWESKKNLFYHGTSSNWFGEDFKFIENPNVKINMWKFCKNHSIEILHDKEQILKVFEYFQYCTGKLQDSTAIRSNLENVTIVYLKDGGYILIRPSLNPSFYDFMGMTFALRYTKDTVLSELDKIKHLIQVAFTLSKGAPALKQELECGMKRKAACLEAPSVWISKKKIME